MCVIDTNYLSHSAGTSVPAVQFDSNKNLHKLCYFRFMSYQFSFVVHFGYKYTNVSVTFTVIGVDRWLIRCRWISAIKIINSSWHHQMQLIFRMKWGIPNGDIDFQLSRNYSRFQCHKNTSFRLRSIEQTFQSPQCAWPSSSWLHLQF